MTSLTHSFAKAFITLLALATLLGCNGQTAGIDANAAANTNNTGGNSTSSNPQAALTLSWAAPAEREDESTIAMSEIAGYNLYYGSVMGQYPNRLAIDDAYTTLVDIDSLNLPAGTYYVVMTTVDVNGRESAHSDMLEIHV